MLKVAKKKIPWHVTITTAVWTGVPTEISSGFIGSFILYRFFYVPVTIHSRVFEGISTLLRLNAYLVNI